MTGAWSSAAKGVIKEFYIESGLRDRQSKEIAGRGSNMSVAGSRASEQANVDFTIDHGCSKFGPLA